MKFRDLHWRCRVPRGVAEAVVAVVFSGGLGLAMSTSATIAQADMPTDTLRACQRIEDRTTRFLCYDALELSAQTQAPTGDPVSRSRARRDFGKSESKREVKRKEYITVRVVSAERNLSGNWIFRTDEGQAWRQTGSERVQFRDQEFQAEIRKAALGGYFLVPEGRRARVRVIRIK